MDSTGNSTQYSVMTYYENRILKRVGICIDTHIGFPGGSDGKESACNAGDPGLIPGSGRSPGEGTGNPDQYSCLENSMDRGAWLATFNRVSKSST